MMKRRKLFLFLAILTPLMLNACSNLFLSQPIHEVNVVSFHEMVKLIQQGQVRRIIIESETVKIVKKDGEQLESRKQPNVNLIDALLDAGVTKEQVAEIDFVTRAP